MSAGWGTAWLRAQALLQMILPSLCPVCQRTVACGDSLCPDCWKEVHFLDGPVCARCGVPFEVDPGAQMLCGACLARLPFFDRARAVLRYSDTSKAPVLALKHADRLDLAPLLARWMLRCGAELIADSDCIVPVPLHWRRLWLRRYNQAAELARYLAGATGLPYAPQLLHRLRATKSQGDMPSARARRRNVRGVFTVPMVQRNSVAGQRILLIDDVLTTGATADACARVLLRAGAKNVSVLAVARVVREAGSIV